MGNILDAVDTEKHWEEWNIALWDSLIPPDLCVLQLLRDLSHGEVVQHGRGGRVVPRYPRTRRVQPRGVERLVIRVLDVD